MPSEVRIEGLSRPKMDEKIQTVVDSYKDVFGVPVELPLQRSHDHKIPLVEGALPVNIRPYKHPPTQKNAIEKELIDELHRAKLFIKLDLGSGYHQIKMNKADVAKTKTAFRTHEGRYKFLVMPFGLTNAPSTFQSLMNEILKKRAYTLNSEAQSAFEALKQAMICALVLKLPNFAKKFIIETDALELRRKGKLMVENDEALRKELLQQVHKVPLVAIHESSLPQRYKPNLEAYLGLLQPPPIPTSIYTNISMDFIKGLPKSQVKDVILVVVERLSKYAHFMALSHPFTVSQVAQMFLDNIYKLHGLVENIMSDMDKMYDRRITKQWLKWLTLAESWSNTNFHTSIHTTPYEAVYGKAPPIHISYIGGESKVDLVDKTLSESETDVETFKFHISRAQSRMKSHDDKGRTDKQFDCGDWVFLKLQPYRQVSLRKAKQNKFSPKFFGPFKVIQKIRELAYKLELPNDSQIHNVFHVSQLKKYRHPSPNQVCRNLPPCDISGVFLMEPISILDIRMAKKRNEVEFYVLV
uniref:Reverse transcriptase domain-containing protein n=1 Tax=Tanacetum cinerariifolium TaxID=118510 RepID=A0A699IEW8_TANCI|nr:hypothetical protein [Tanacetum cinerariifolium]